MSFYVVSYDLVDERDYKKICEPLKNYNATQLLRSTWCFKKDGTSAKWLKDYFSIFIDSDDRLLVLEVSDWSGLRTIGTPGTPGTPDGEKF